MNLFIIQMTDGKLLLDFNKRVRTFKSLDEAGRVIKNRLNKRPKFRERGAKQILEFTVTEQETGGTDIQTNAYPVVIKRKEEE